MLMPLLWLGGCCSAGEVVPLDIILEKIRSTQPYEVGPGGAEAALPVSRATSACPWDSSVDSRRAWVPLPPPQNRAGVHGALDAVRALL